MLDFEWVAIAVGDVTWISVAFILGFAAHLVRLPPLIGFLLAGFVLNAFGFTSGEMLNKLADLGITLLLFAVGLKLDIKSLVKPQIWAVTSLHMTITIISVVLIMSFLAMVGVSIFSSLSMYSILLIGFALSFSSTVFAVKMLEEKQEVTSLHGRLAIGILVMQDLVAVLFLAASEGKLPTYYAPLIVIGLVLLRPLLFYVLRKAGHGELLVLYALVLAIGGANLFEMVGIKDDLGALFLGVLISQHPKGREMSHVIMSFKDLFLVGFFLTIGMSGNLSIESIVVGLSLIPLVFLKSALFFRLMTAMKVRARTALFSTLNLSNFSEFGLIVAALGAANGWISPDWLVILAIALSFSFVLAAPLCRNESQLYTRFYDTWVSYQRSERLPEDQSHDVGGATIVIIGMGRVGAGAYDQMSKLHGDKVIGIDFDERLIEKHQTFGRQVIRGNPTDPDFWENFETKPDFQLILLALPNTESSLEVIKNLRDLGYSNDIAATVHYPEDEKTLLDAGAIHVYNIYKNTGMSLARSYENRHMYVNSKTSTQEAPD